MSGRVTSAGERIAWILVVVLLLVGGAAGFYLLQGRTAAATRGERSAKAEAQRLAAELQAARADERAGPAGGITPAGAGIAGDDAIAPEVPESEYPRIIADLQKHPELIPHKPVLGGTMAFYSPKEIRVLGPRWVIAPFEDGHIAGVALLRFRIGPDRKIHWKLLDSYML